MELNAQNPCHKCGIPFADHCGIPSDNHDGNPSDDHDGSPATTDVEKCSYFECMQSNEALCICPESDASQYDVMDYFSNKEIVHLSECKYTGFTTVTINRDSVVTATIINNKTLEEVDVCPLRNCNCINRSWKL